MSIRHFIEIYVLTQNISAFETTGKLNLYLSMIVDSYRIPVTANDFVTYYSEIYVYLFNSKKSLKYKVAVLQSRQQ